MYGSKLDDVVAVGNGRRCVSSARFDDVIGQFGFEGTAAIGAHGVGEALQ